MIKNLTPLTIVEAKELSGDLEDRKELERYFKKYSKMKKDKAMELKKELEGINSLKIRDVHIVKIVDFLPKDAESLNKIFNDVSLDQKETDEILEITGKY